MTGRFSNPMADYEIYIDLRPSGNDFYGDVTAWKAGEVDLDGKILGSTAEFLSIEDVMSAADRLVEGAGFVLADVGVNEWLWSSDHMEFWRPAVFVSEDKPDDKAEEIVLNGKRYRYVEEV